MTNHTKMLEIPGLIDERKTQIMGDIMKLMDIIQDKEYLMEDMYNCKRKAPTVVEELLSEDTAGMAWNVPESARAAPTHPQPVHGAESLMDSKLLS
jgi:hypothetical protein